MSGTYFAFPTSGQSYGFGSQNRIVGSSFLGSPRSKIGSANRIYGYLSRTEGSYVALNLIRSYSGFGPYFIQNNKLVWN